MMKEKKKELPEPVLFLPLDQTSVFGSLQRHSELLKEELDDQGLKATKEQGEVDEWMVRVIQINRFHSLHYFFECQT